MPEYPKLASVRQTAQRCADENLGVSYKQLQSWIRGGQLKTIPCGKTRRLVNWDVLQEFIAGGELADVSPLPYRKRGYRR